MIAKTQTQLSTLLNQFRGAGLHTALRQDRENADSVDVAIPGQRWEIDVLDDGSIEVEVFRSDGTIGGSTDLSRLIAEHS